MRLFLMIGVSFFLACNDSHEPAVDKTTAVFSYYLHAAFGDSIRKEKQTYVLIPKIGCKGCREGALAELHQEIIKSGEKHLTYIFSPSVNLADTLVKPCNFLIDKSELIDKINLPISNITFIKTENGKVISLVSVRSETMDSIGYFLRN